MESSSDRQPTKDKTFPLIFLVLCSLLQSPTQASPHQVYNYTWQILNHAGDIVNTSSRLGSTPPWDPLQVDLCVLALGVEDPGGPLAGWGTPYEYWPQPKPIEATDPKKRLRCAHARGRGRLSLIPIYVCPGLHRPKSTWTKCGSGSYRPAHCKAWGCETTGDTYWKPSSSWDYITLKRLNPPSRETRDPTVLGEPTDKTVRQCKASWCNPLQITFTEAGKKAPWEATSTGFQWSICLYEQGPDDCLNFKIRLRKKALEQALALGPNPVLNDARPPPPPQKPQAPIGLTSRGTPDTSTTPDPFPRPGTGDRLFQVIQGAYQTLNLTDPEKTQECWLCLDSAPPYYEGLAVSAQSLTNVTAPPQSCTVTRSHKLTLSEVSGVGLCIGSVPPSHQGLCNQRLQVMAGSYYLLGPNGTYWACNSGLTPCVSAQVLNQSTDFCVLIELWPKIFYHDPEYVYHHYEGLTRYPREPVSITLALLLGGLTVGGITAGIGTGAAALAETSQFKLLQQAMHADLQALEESVSALEKSLTSLSEVVLQNRRGLDILFLREGGLCAALKEECCFYADHTGLVRDNMAKLRERLRQRQHLFESTQSWYERMFNGSPWFTTLISSLMGPLVIVLLLLILGPYILNRLTQFVKDRLSVVQAMVLTHQYQQLNQGTEIE